MFVFAYNVGSFFVAYSDVSLCLLVTLLGKKPYFHDGGPGVAFTRHEETAPQENSENCSQTSGGCHVLSDRPCDYYGKVHVWSSSQILGLDLLFIQIRIICPN